MTEELIILTDENLSEAVWAVVRRLREKVNAKLPKYAPPPNGSTVSLYDEDTRDQRAAFIPQSHDEPGVVYTHWHITLPSGTRDIVLGPEKKMLDRLPISWSTYVYEDGRVFVHARYIVGQELMQTPVSRAGVRAVQLGSLPNKIMPFLTKEALTVLNSLDPEVLSQVRNQWGFQDEVLEFRRALMDALPVMEP